MKRLFNLFALIIGLTLLTGCQSKWDIEVELTPEQEEQVYGEINTVKQTIRNQIDENGQAEIQAYVLLARGYKQLGDYRKAAKVYEDLIDDGFTSSALHNNLGRIYETVGENEKAIEQFQILVDRFVSPGYLRDITLLHIELKNRREAEKYFNAWQLEFNDTDVQIQDKIKALRAEEKANK